MYVIYLDVFNENAKTPVRNGAKNDNTLCAIALNRRTRSAEKDPPFGRIYSSTECYTLCTMKKTHKRNKGNMTTIAHKKQYVVDERGDRVGILLSLEDYQKLLDELEELESLRAYDVAKASSDEAIPEIWKRK